MVKSKKQRTAGFWTVSRARMVETMTAHRKTPAEIADALGCSTEMVVDFLRGKVDDPAPDRLFFVIERKGGE